MLLLWALISSISFAESVDMNIALTRQRSMEVTARYPAASHAEEAFEIGTDNVVSGPDFKDNIEDVRAEDHAGSALKVSHPSSRRWIVRSDGRPFTIRYLVRCRKTSFREGDRVFDPSLFPDWALVLGWTFVLSPQDDALVALPILVHVEGGGLSPVLTSWDSQRPISLDELKQSLIVAGDFRVHRTGIGDVPITIAIQGRRWRFSDAEFQSKLVKIIGSEEHAMGFFPYPSLLVALVEDNRGYYIGGTALTRAFVGYDDPQNDRSNNDFALEKMVAHEHFHEWSPKYGHAKQALPEGESKWLTEGGTEYFAYLTLLREGMISPAAFAKEVNQWIERYYENPVALTATINDIDKHLYDGDRRFEQLCYFKGSLLVMLLDLEIRRRTGGRAKIDDFFRTVMKRYPPDSEGYDNAALRRIAEELAGASFDDFFARYVLGNSELPLKQVLERNGFKVEDFEPQVFQLGFSADHDLARGARVKTVDPGSAAEKAGVEVGDILAGIDLAFRTDYQAHLKLRRGTREVAASFYPARPLGRRIPRISENRSNEKPISAL